MTQIYKTGIVTSDVFYEQDGTNNSVPSSIPSVSNNSSTTAEQIRMKIGKNTDYIVTREFIEW